MTVLSIANISDPLCTYVHYGTAELDGGSCGCACLGNGELDGDRRGNKHKNEVRAFRQGRGSVVKKIFFSLGCHTWLLIFFSAAPVFDCRVPLDFLVAAVLFWCRLV
jgi:hypothetical protein